MSAQTLTRPAFQHCELKHQGLRIPSRVSRWQSRLKPDSTSHNPYRPSAPGSAAPDPGWHWPNRPICVLTDLHADADALFGSLVAAGFIAKQGPQDDAFTITPLGKRSLLLINGDCFDKGPSNLRLLRCIHGLQKAGARIKLIAGNHDVRFLAGIRALQQPQDLMSQNFFLRMAPKGVAFLHEVYESHVADLRPEQKQRYGEGLPDERVRERLYPDEAWYEHFPKLASSWMSSSKIASEMEKTDKKRRQFESLWLETGLSLDKAYAATNRWRELFCHPQGEFSWFFESMDLLHSEGSFLFAHAGMDDVMARAFARLGAENLNQGFRNSLREDLFGLYFGPMGNVFRSKYRRSDYDFTPSGAGHLLKQNIRALVHGHINHHTGQEYVIRQGIYHFECDASLDYGTRRKEGLTGRGAAATWIRPDGCILGISVDHPSVKLFRPPQAGPLQNAEPDYGKYEQETAETGYHSGSGFHQSLPEADY